MSSVRVVDGTEVECRGSSNVEMVAQGMRLRLHVIVIDRVVNGINVEMDVDAIVQFGKCYCH